MISRTYDPTAKPLVSLGEMNAVDLTGFPFHRGPKRNGAKSTAAPWGLLGFARRTSDGPAGHWPEGEPK
jgi:hypothetical protein